MSGIPMDIELVLSKTRHLSRWAMGHWGEISKSVSESCMKTMAEFGGSLSDFVVAIQLRIDQEAIEIGTVDLDYARDNVPEEFRRDLESAIVGRDENSIVVALTNGVNWQFWSTPFCPECVAEA